MAGRADPARPSPCRLGGRLRAASAPRCGPAGHLAGAVIAEIGRLGAAARVRVRDTQSGALAFADFSAAIVANENGLSSHDIPPGNRRWAETGELY